MLVVTLPVKIFIASLNSNANLFVSSLIVVSFLTKLLYQVKESLLMIPFYLPRFFVKCFL